MQHSLLPNRGASCSEQPPLENYGQTEHEGKARPGPGEDSMTVWQDVLSYTLCVPTRAQTAQQGHTWEEEEERARCRTCCCCFVSTCLCMCLHECVWAPDAGKDISSPSLAWRDSGMHPRCQQRWQHHQQNVSVANTHKCTQTLTDCCRATWEKHSKCV